MDMENNDSKLDLLASVPEVPAIFKVFPLQTIVVWYYWNQLLKNSAKIMMQPLIIESLRFMDAQYWEGIL